MSDAIEQAKDSFGRWNTAFNARDMEGMVAEIHFPHRRLSGDIEFQVRRTEADFSSTRGDDATASLAAQEWHHTATISVVAVQSTADKVHLAINQFGRRADDSEYNGFPTLWIFTKIDGRWGVQFRSSFLQDPMPPSGDVSE